MRWNLRARTPTHFRGPTRLAGATALCKDRDGNDQLGLSCWALSTDSTKSLRHIMLIIIITIIIVIIIGQSQPSSFLSPAQAPPPSSPCRMLASIPLLSPPHSLFLAFMFLPPVAVSSPVSPSSLFYLNLPQICSPTKQLPSLFWAIICGSAARVGPPGRQSPGNRVSASYCGVCPSRSITRRLTPRGRRPESPRVTLGLSLPPLHRRTRPGRGDPGRSPQPEGHAGAAALQRCQEPRGSSSCDLHSSSIREGSLFYPVLQM